MWRWLCWWRPPCLLRRVVLQFTHTETEAFEGILWSSRGPWLTLRDVSALKAGKPPQPIPGDLVVHRSQVAYLQVGS
jgi:hypothetical protein